MAGPNKNTDNPLHLHIDCTQGISAQSFLDGLRGLVRSSGDEHARDAMQIDAMSAAIWMQHIPNNDRQVLQEGGRIVNQETPVESWEPFRKAIRESPVEVSERVVCQLKEVLDAIEKYYDDEVKKVYPLYPSVVWHMMAVVLLLDRLRIRTMTASAVPRSANAPKVLAEILKEFPVSSTKGENPAKTTFDGAILMHVLKPASPFAPDRVFHGKAVGRDGMIETELGLTYQTLQVATESTTRDGGIAPNQQQQQQNQQAQPRAAPTQSVAPRQTQTAQPAKGRSVPQQVDIPNMQHKATAQPRQTQALVAQQQSQQIADKSSAKGLPPPADDKEAGALESPLWNVEKDMTLLQTNIDDMTGEHLAFCAELLFQQGALDVWLTPIIMKKGRAAQQLNCLTKDEKVEQLLITIFRQTSTLGVRAWSSSGGFQRISLRREIVTVEYCRRPVQVKVAYLGKEPVSLKPEYDQCAQLSYDTKIPIVVVTEEVKNLAKDHTRRKVLAMI